MTVFSMFPDFSVRSSRQELMDDLSIQGAELRETLDGLERINRIFRGYEPSLDGVAALLQMRPEQRRFRLLDVGTGSADTPRVLSRWAAAQNLAIDIHGIDLTPTTIEHARQRSRDYPNISIHQQNLFALENQHPFDVVHAALMLHHLSDADAIRALRKMFELSVLGIVINDLHRHPLNFAGSHVLLPMVSKNRLIRHDGPLSVLRAFTRAELRSLIARADLPEPQIIWRAPFRWQVIIRRAER